MDPINALLNSVPSLHNVDTWLALHGKKLSLDKLYNPLVEKIKSLRSDKEKDSVTPQLAGAIRILHHIVSAQTAARGKDSGLSTTFLAGVLPNTLKHKDFGVRVESLILLSDAVVKVTGVLGSDETKYFLRAFECPEPAIRTVAVKALTPTLNCCKDSSELDSLINQLLKMITEEKSNDVQIGLHESLARALTVLCVNAQNAAAAAGGDKQLRARSNTKLRLGKFQLSLSKSASQTCIDPMTTLTYLASHCVKKPTRFYGSVSFPALITNISEWDGSAIVQSVVSTLQNLPKELETSKVLLIIDAFVKLIYVFPSSQVGQVLNEIIHALPTITEEVALVVLWRMVGAALLISHPEHSEVHEPLLELLPNIFQASSTYANVLGLTVTTFISLCPYLGPKLIQDYRKANSPRGVLYTLLGASSCGIRYHDGLWSELTTYAEEVYQSSAEGIVAITTGIISMYGSIRSELLWNSVLSLPPSAVLPRMLFSKLTVQTLLQLTNEHVGRGPIMEDNTNTRNTAIFYAFCAKNIQTLVTLFRSHQGSELLGQLLKGALAQMHSSCTQAMYLVQPESNNTNIEEADLLDLDPFLTGFGVQIFGENLSSTAKLRRQVFISACALLTRLYAYQNGENRALLVTRVMDIFQNIIKGSTDSVKFATACNVVEWIAQTLQKEETVTVANTVAFKSIISFLIENVLGKSYTHWAYKHSVALHTRICEICEKIGTLDMENLTGFMKVAVFKASHLPVLMFLYRKFNLTFIPLTNVQTMLSTLLKGENRDDIYLGVHALANLCQGETASIEQMLFPLFDVFVVNVWSNSKTFRFVVPGTFAGDELNRMFLKSYECVTVRPGTLSGDASLRRIASQYGVTAQTKNVLDDILDCGDLTPTKKKDVLTVQTATAKFQDSVNNAASRVEAIKFILTADPLERTPLVLLTAILQCFKQSSIQNMDALYVQLIRLLGRVLADAPELLEDYATQVEVTIRDALRSMWPHVVMEACDVVNTYPIAERKVKLLSVWIMSPTLKDLLYQYANFGVQESLKVGMKILATAANIFIEKPFEVSEDLTNVWLTALGKFPLDAAQYGTAYNDIARTLNVVPCPYVFDDAWKKIQPTLAEWVLYVFDEGIVTSVKTLPLPPVNSTYTLPPPDAINRFVRTRLQNEDQMGIVAWFGCFPNLPMEVRYVILNALLTNRCVELLGTIAASTLRPEDIACFLSLNPDSITHYDRWLASRRPINQCFDSCNILELRLLCESNESVMTDDRIGAKDWCDFFYKHATLVSKYSVLSTAFTKKFPSLVAVPTNPVLATTETLTSLFNMLQAFESDALPVVLSTYMATLKCLGGDNPAVTTFRDKVQSALVRNASDVKDLFATAPTAFVQEFKANLIANPPKKEAEKLSFGGLNVGAFAKHSFVKREYQ